MSASLLTSPRSARILGVAAAGYIRLVGAVSRWTYVNEEAAAEHLAANGPLIFAFWHNRFSLMPLVYNNRLRRRRIAVMVSRSRDGELLAALIGSFGFHSARGSSSRGGRAALLELARLLADGSDVAVTPDGPRGPRYRVQDGAVALASVSGAPLLPASFAVSRCLILRKSWDHMRIPLPLGRIGFAFGPPLLVPPGLDREARGVWCRRLEEGLLQADRSASEVLINTGKMSCPSP